MQKTVYYREIIRRENLLLKNIFDIFFRLASYPRLLIEVFIRKNFGQRYFSVASVLTIGVLLILYPIIFKKRGPVFSSRYDYDPNHSVLGDNILWYLFVAAFLLFSYIRWAEIRKNPSVFTFQKFSLYYGDINPFFYSIKFDGKKPKMRTVEIFYEPAPFLLLGIILWWMGQKLGILLTVSAICYSISYAAAYSRGDNFMMDQIDQMILNEEKYKIFVEDLPPDKTRGAEHRGELPTDREKAILLADAISNEGFSLAS